MPIVSKRMLQKLALLAFILINNLSALSQKQDSSSKQYEEESIIKYFSKLDLEAFEGKIVDSFLHTLEHPFSKVKVERSSGMFYAGVVKAYYPQGIIAHLFLDEFKRSNPQGICRKRNIKLARKEVIAAIQIHNDVACIQGCD